MLDPSPPTPGPAAANCALSHVPDPRTSASPKRKAQLSQAPSHVSTAPLRYLMLELAWRARPSINAREDPFGVIYRWAYPGSTPLSRCGDRGELFDVLGELLGKLGRAGRHLVVPSVEREAALLWPAAQRVLGVISHVR